MEKLAGNQKLVANSNIASGGGYRSRQNMSDKL